MRRGDKETRAVLKPLVEQKFNERLKDMEDRVWLEKLKYQSEIIFIIAILTLSLIASCSLAHAEEYTDEEYVNAIYIAEGGAKAQYPYGIRSVKCSGKLECRRICKNTVRNNRRRYKEFGHKKFSSFTQFLGSRYCPVGAGNDPTGKNVNWVRNVEFQLTKGRK